MCSLAPTGMAAQFAALNAVSRRAPGRPTAQLGFPYVDTLKLNRSWVMAAYCCITSTVSRGASGTAGGANRWRLVSERFPAIRCWARQICGGSVLSPAAPGAFCRGRRGGHALNVDLSPYADLVATA